MKMGVFYYSQCFYRKIDLGRRLPCKNTDSEGRHRLRRKKDKQRWRQGQDPGFKTLRDAWGFQKLEELRKGSPLETEEWACPGQHIDIVFSASGAVRQYFYFKPAGCGALLSSYRE